MVKGFENSSTKNTNVEFYERFAPFYQQHYGVIEPSVTVKQWAAKLADLRFVPEASSRDERGKMRLIDIGCGPGAFLLEWAREGFQVTGLDSSSKMVNFAERHLRSNCPHQFYQLIQTDIRDIRDDCNDQEFDLAVSHFNFLNLFSVDQLTPVFKSVWSFLKPGGVWMTDFCEVTGNLGDVEWDDQVRDSSGCVRRREHFRPEEAYLEIYWVGKQIDMIERYWLKNRQAIRQSAKKVGFQQKILNQQQSICGKLDGEHSGALINRLITVFIKSSGHGHSEPKNLEDRSNSARIF